MDYSIILLIAFIVILLIPTTKSRSAPKKEVLHLEEFREFKKDYMQSYIWKDKRELVKTRDNYMCQKCGTSSQLHVHHMWGYEQIPNEPIEALITLCKGCHLREHQKVGFPDSVIGYYEFNHPIQPRSFKAVVPLSRGVFKPKRNKVEILDI